MVDWDAGNYEATAAELAPVAQAVVERARISAGEDVLDLACGTGNAALLAAARGGRVVGVDAAPRLLAVARERARADELDVDFREGDLLALPVEDDAVDVVISVFGVIFAQDRAQALREVARVLRPSGRALITAWIPEGPIDALLTAMGRIVRRITSAPPPEPSPWSDPDAVGALAAEAGLTLAATKSGELAIRAASPEEYFDDRRDHPMSLAMQPVIEGAGAADEVREAAVSVLREANEHPDGFLVHSPYVVHELRPAG